MAPQPRYERQEHMLYCERCEEVYTMEVRMVSVETSDRGTQGWVMADGNECPKGHDTDLRLMSN